MAKQFATFAADKLRVTTRLPDPLTFSVSFWAKATSIGPGFHPFFYRFNSSGTPFVFFGLDAAGVATVITGYKLGSSSVNITGPTVAAGAWHHYALTMSAAAFQAAYVDGVLIGAGAPETGGSGSPLTTNDMLLFGHDDDLDAESGLCSLAAVKFWDGVVLAADQIADEMGTATARRRDGLYLEAPLYSGQDPYLSGGLCWDVFAGTITDPDEPPGLIYELPSRRVRAAAAGGVANTQTNAGSVTPVGTLIKSVLKTTAGSTSGTGAMVRKATKFLTGSISASGNVLKLLPRTLAGSSVVAGTLAKRPAKSLAGSSTSTGSIIKADIKALTGSSSASGALVESIAKIFTGSETAAGALVKLDRKTVVGSSAPSGTATSIGVKLQTLTGSMTPAGATLRQTAKTLTGTTTAAGVLMKKGIKTLAGLVTSSGTQARLTTKALVGSTTPTGAIVNRKSKFQTLAGSLTPAGAVLKAVGKVLAGTIPASGVLEKFVRKILAGVVSTVGNLILDHLGQQAPPPVTIVTIAFSHTRTVALDLTHRRIVTLAE